MGLATQSEEASARGRNSCVIAKITVRVSRRCFPPARLHDRSKSIAPLPSMTNLCLRFRAAFDFEAASLTVIAIATFGDGYASKLA